MLITNISYTRLTKIMRKFNSTFLNLFSDLTNDHVPTKWAFDIAHEIVGKMLEKGYCEPTCCININSSLQEFPKEFILEYTSRTGKEYKFTISREDWYRNSFEYPADSQLAAEFEAA